MAELEGPVFYRCMVRRERLGRTAVAALVDRFLLHPPLRTRVDGR